MDVVTYWFLPAAVVGALIGSLIGALLAGLARLPPLKRRLAKINRKVVMIGSAIVVFVAVYMLSAISAARLNSGFFSILAMPYKERICVDGRVKSEAWLSSLEPVAYQIYQAAEQIEPAILMELWLREMFSGPKCGPCYILDGSDCDLYIQYFDARAGDYRSFMLILAMIVSLVDGLVFHLLTRKL